MKKYIISTLLLMAVAVPTAWAQGFRVYNHDGTILQFSLRTDSIVFYDGIGSEQDLNLFTPMNQCIVGTWYKSKSESVTFNEDGTTDYNEHGDEWIGGKYEFFPFQGNLIVYSNNRNRCYLLHIPKMTKDSIIMGGTGASDKFFVYTRTPQPQLVTEIVLGETSLNLQTDEVRNLTVTVLPEDADNKELIWGSSDTNVAEVNGRGRIIANGVGTCVITCRTTDGSGVYAKCEIIVMDNDNTHGFTNGHEWVDLGLPSGTLWATCNVGASSPEEFGDYFAWGEKEMKVDYSWSTYLHCKGTSNSIKKYCTNSEYGYYGFMDDITELESIDDAATANWGEEWRMPSKEQVSELINYIYTTTEYKTLNGNNGQLITSKSNGRSIFLPAAGYYASENWSGNVGYGGYYWSYSLDSYCLEAIGIYLFPSDIYVTGSKRNYGHSVRPVRR